MNDNYKRRIIRSFGRAAHEYDQAANLQRQTGDTLLWRVESLRLQPMRLLDLGAGTGYCTTRLIRNFPHAQIIALDIAQEMLSAMQSRTIQGQCLMICGDAEALPLKDDSLDLIFSNLVLQWCREPETVLNELARCLVTGGYVLFNSLGTATLAELREAWRQIDDRTHVNAFLSAEDWRVLLLSAGFDVLLLKNERISFQYTDVYAVMRELKTLGARNQTEDRPRHLMGKRAMARMISAYQAAMPDGRIQAGFEVIQMVARKRG